MSSVEINSLAVLVATILNVAIGAIWFNVIFSKQWSASVGQTAEEIQAKFTPLKPMSSVLASLVQALTLSAILDWANITSLGNGLLVGVVIGVGIVAMTSLVTDYFENRPWLLYGLNAGHNILTLAVMGALLGAWQ